VLLGRAEPFAEARGGHVEQDHRVVVGGAGLGDVCAEALAGGAFQLHALEAEGDGADVGMVEGLLLRSGAPGDVVAFPQPGEVGALDQELADQGSQVGGVGVGAGQGAQAGDAAADLVIPVSVEVARRGMEEQEAADVALGAGQSSMPA
jgi:hypothetical protein